MYVVEICINARTIRLKAYVFVLMSIKADSACS